MHTEKQNIYRIFVVPGICPTLLDIPHIETLGVLIDDKTIRQAVGIR